MTTVIERKDVLAMILPADQLGVTEHDPKVYILLYQACVSYVHREYEDLPEDKRPTITFQKIETLATKDPRELDDFPLSHDCDGCREVVNAARQALLASPNDIAGIANVYYTEYHDD